MGKWFRFVPYHQPEVIAYTEAEIAAGKAQSVFHNRFFAMAAFDFVAANRRVIK